jgi:hypothetical protein
VEVLPVSDTPSSLSFTATTARGEVVEFQLPLHPHTASVAQVGSMLEALLDAVTVLLDQHPGVSDGDVLQAMTLAMAVRMGVAGIGENPGRQLLDELVDATVTGAESASTVSGASRRH